MKNKCDTYQQYKCKTHIVSISVRFLTYFTLYCVNTCMHTFMCPYLAHDFKIITLQDLSKTPLRKGATFVEYLTNIFSEL
jgi:hypothetical protein